MAPAVCQSRVHRAFHRSFERTGPRPNEQVHTTRIPQEARALPELSQFRAPERQAQSRHVPTGNDRATDLELKWIEALLELYQFAEDNRTHIGMHTTAELTFDDENVRSQFMALANKVDDLADQSAKVAVVFDSAHQRHRQRMSFTARDARQP